MQASGKRAKNSPREHDRVVTEWQSGRITVQGEWLSTGVGSPMVPNTHPPPPPVPETRRHAVWDVYKELRTARLNVLYHANRSAHYRAVSAWLDLLTGLSGLSALGGAWIGEKYWGVASGLVTVALPVLRNFLRLTERIRQHDDCAKSYDVLQYDLSVLRQDIANAHEYLPQHQDSFRRAQDRRRKLIEEDPDRVRDDRLARTCQAQVNREFRKSDFFVPGGSS